MKQIQEIYWLRFYGCLAVFTFHLIDRIERNYLEHPILDLAYIPTVLGTPIFIFISIFLFSARYGDQIPHNFLARRLKYVMIPYAVYGVIYCVAEYVRLWMSGEPVPLLPHLMEYLVFAGWHGYFLIVAMQFYVLFWCYNRFRLWRWLPAGPSLVAGALVSIAWWGFFRWHSVEPPGYLHWIAPLGWIYLFFLALLLVRHYPDLQSQGWFRWLSNPLLLLLFLAGVVAFTLAGTLEYSSKETWVVPLFILALLWSLPRLAGRTATPLVKKVNQASFGIYLAHPLFFSVVDFVTWQVDVPLWAYVIALLVVGMTGSLALNYLANRSDWSAMMFGRQLKVA
ncbi:acyltransferase family protein [Marinobacter sp.]|uniref:acyltransferase family protein n=1 Tax=Marinobacter sp. TaxID=50741 RepID=UPI0035622FBE